nr:reverse transcriptase domain-containing protein [Tanacetum cinerariifolium]
MTSAEINQIVAQRVTNAIEAIVVYEGMTTAYNIGANERRTYVGNLPYYNKCKLHHVGSCTVKTSVAAMNQRADVANPKATITCYECGRLGYFRDKFKKLRNQNQVNQIWKEKARKNSSAIKDKTNA